jgi:hypothetical protein
MATTEGAIAVAWIASAPIPPDQSYSRIGDAYFQRFRADLSPLDSARQITSNVSQIAIAATPSGYLLAVGKGTFASSVIELHPLTAAGDPRGPVRQVAGGDPYLASRQEPGKRVVGGPLLVLAQASAVNPQVLVQRVAQLLDEGGSPERPAEVVGAYANNDPVSAAFTGDGFLYASDERPVTITRIEPSGKVAERHSVASKWTEYPQIAWNGSEGLFTYGAFRVARGVWLQRVTRRGALVGEPVLVGAEPEHMDVSPVLAVGHDYLILLGDANSSEPQHKLHVLRVSPDGKLVGSVYPLVRDVHRWATYSLGARGPDVIAMWTRWVSGLAEIDAEIELARLTP